jgi:signal transduction histidine kinase
MYWHLNRDSILHLKENALKLQQTEESLQKEIKRRKELEIALKASEERLVHLEHSMTIRLQKAQKLEAIGTLASGIAHDFNNILAVVSGNCELVQTILEADAPVQHFLTAIATAGERAKDLVQQILAFSRNQEETQKPTLIYIVINEALKLMRASLPATIEFKINICRDIFYVMADVVQLYQIIVKLCIDLTKAMEEKGGILSVTLSPINIDPAVIPHFEDVTAGSYLQLEIANTNKDSGLDQLDFFLTDRLSSRNGQDDTGFGFCEIKKIITEHQGDIRVASEPGVGTIFKIILPIIAPEEAKTNFVKVGLPTGTERIQFIDDESAIADAGGQFFTRLGYEVSCFDDSIQAWENFQAFPSKYDLVITDLTMPSITGKTLARQIVALRPDIPVILCSGHSKELLSKTAHKEGISAIAHKPLMFAELAHTARRLLDAALLSKISVHHPPPGQAST